MYKKGAGNDKQGKDAGNRTLCPYRNFSQAIMFSTVGVILSAAGDIMNNVGERCSAQWRDTMIVQDVQSPEGMKFPDDFSLTFPD